LAPNSAFARMIDLGGNNSQKVHVKGNLYHRTLEVTAPQLQVAGIKTPTFNSASCLLKGFDLKLGENTGSLSFSSATLDKAVFVRGAEHVIAAAVEIDQVNALVQDGGAGTMASALTFNEAKVTGIVYPNMPPVDLDFKQAGLSFKALWQSVSAKNAS